MDSPSPSPRLGILGHQHLDLNLGHLLLLLLRPLQHQLVDLDLIGDLEELVDLSLHLDLIRDLEEAVDLSNLHLELIGDLEVNLRLGTLGQHHLELNLGHLVVPLRPHQQAQGALQTHQ